MDTAHTKLVHWAYPAMLGLFVTMILWRKIVNTWHGMELKLQKKGFVLLSISNTWIFIYIFGYTCNIRLC